jgi:hypothetical protein
MGYRKGVLTGLYQHGNESLGLYEGESVNRQYIDIKRKTCDIRFEPEKNLFLDVFSINIDTLVPSLYRASKHAA